MRWPTARDAVRFAGATVKSNRASAWRGLVDGAWVIWRLRRGAAKRVLPQPRIVDVTPASIERARAVSTAVDAGLGVLPVEATCLRRSVTLLRELRRRKLPGRLYIGIRRNGSRIEAHAWVDAGEAVINDDPALTASYDVISAGELERFLPALR